MYLNKVQIIGNLTRNPEQKALPSGMQVTNFSVASNRFWRDKDGQKQEEVEFHNIVAFGKQSDVINQYFKKGDQIYVEGRLKTRSWEVDGHKNYRTEIVMEKFEFGNKAGKAQDTHQSEEDQISEAQDEYNEEDNIPDSIPF